MQRGTIQQILKDMRVHGQRVPSAQAVHNLMDIDKLNAPKPLSSQGFLKFCYNKANLERYISKNLGKLIQIENNIAMGNGSGVQLEGDYNIALGRSSLAFYKGEGSIAIGAYAQLSLETGTNTVIGHRSLMTGKEVNNNTAIGYETLRRFSVGNRNTAIGHQSINNLTDGIGNTGVGHHTLVNLTTGQLNTAIGHQAGQRLTTGSTNLLLDSDVINATDSNKMNLGNVIYTDRLTNRTYLGRRQEPTAILELREGTGHAGTAPLKFNSGNLLTNAEAGTFEFKDGVLYFTAVAGQRKKVAFE